MRTSPPAHDRFRLVSLSVIAGTRGPQRATLRIADETGTRIEEADGNGPVDAVFNAITSLVPHAAELELYQVHAVTGGTDAQAEVSVRLRDGAPQRHRPRRRPGHPGGLGQGVSLGAEQARGPRRARACAACRGGMRKSAAGGGQSPAALVSARHPRRTWWPPGRIADAIGRIAQLVEQLTLNQRVLGSNPSAPTMTSRHDDPRGSGLRSWRSPPALPPTCASDPQRAFFGRSALHEPRALRSPPSSSCGSPLSSSVP